MLGFGLTLIGGLLAQDASDHTQTVMYHPTGDMQSVPPGIDAQAPLHARYVARLWQCRDSSADEATLLLTIYEAPLDKKYAFRYGDSQDITYCCFALYYENNPLLADFYRNGDGLHSKESLQKLPITPQDRKHLRMVFRRNPNVNELYSGKALLRSALSLPLDSWSERDMSAYLAPAAQHYGGSIYRNKTQKTQICVLAMSAAGVGRDYHNATFNIESRELTEI